ncbi:MAG: polyprenyl diphosphate synthase [Candidatus Thermoplasmatota archaeon]
MRIRPSGIITGALYRLYQRRLLRQVRQGPVPRHIAIIMDGNRRFAREIGLTPSSGHLEGKNKLEEVLTWCMEIGIKVLTVYAFSTENFQRDREEVKELMQIFEESFNAAARDPKVHQHGIRIRAIGDLSLLPEDVRRAIAHAEECTKDYDSYIFNIAVAYGGREEIVQGMRAIAAKVRSGALEPEDINEELFSSHLYTAELPDPDLILRTSGEERISNFLLWQLAYSELYFTDVYWPGLRKIDLLRAVRSYQMRRRRYGR